MGLGEDFGPWLTVRVYVCTCWCMCVQEQNDRI